MASRLAKYADVGVYSVLRITAAGTLVPVGGQVNTTSATTIAAGTQTVTPAAMANIVEGMALAFVNGSGAAEVVQVSAINRTAGTFTALFQNAHSGAYNIFSTRGSFLGPIIVNNPGTSCTLQIWNGHSQMSPGGTMIAAIPLGTNPNYLYKAALDQGLFYTLIVGGAAPDVTIHYLDQPA